MSQTMKSWQYTPAGKGIEAGLRLNDSAPLPPRPKAGRNILVKVQRASIQPADYKLLELPGYARFLGTPITPATGFAGTVTESNVSDFSAGDLVVGCLKIYPKHGALSEYIAVSDNDILAKIDAKQPSDVDDFAGIDASAITAVYDLRGLQAGNKVFINGGSGGTGTFGVQIAKSIGLSVGTTCSTRNVALVSQLGADVVLDYTKCNLVQELQRHVKESGAPFDRAIQNVEAGAWDLYRQSHTFLGKSAAFLHVGMGTSLAGQMDMAKVLAWPGLLGGGKRKLEMPMTPLEQGLLDEAVGLVREKKVRVVVDERFGMDGVVEAFAKSKTGRAVGKIIVKVAE